MAIANEEKIARSEAAESQPERLALELTSLAQESCSATRRDLPVVSVIVRSMDRPTLSDALDSIALQTYSNIEVVLVNATGTRHCQNAERPGHFALRFVDSSVRLGRSRAANMGLDAARGDYLIFLDDDDWFEPNHIQNLVDGIRLRPQFRVIYSGVKCVNARKEPLTTRFDAPFDPIRLLADNFIPIHAALFSRDLLRLGCRLDESMELYEDWDFWLQLLQHGDFLQVDDLTAVYRITDDSGFGVNADSAIAEPARRALHKKWFNRLSVERITGLMAVIRHDKAKSAQIADLQQTLAKRMGQIADLDHAVAMRDWTIGESDRIVALRDGQIANLGQSIAARNEQIAELELTIVARDRQVKDLDHAVAERDWQITNLNHMVTERDMRIGNLVRSTSWRITRPFRLVSRLVRGERPLVATGLRARLLVYGKPVYERLPNSIRTDVLYWFYRNLGVLFKGTPHYERWKGSLSHAGVHAVTGNSMVQIDTLTQAPHAQGRIAIHLHMYYHDLAEEFSRYLKNMPFEYDLYVSVANQQGLGVCRQVFTGLAKQGSLVIEQVPNRGRDIAPMFCAFGSRLSDYDYVAHLHSKKSLYNNGATEGWREYLCANLLGSTERIRQIFALMQADAPRGIVYPQNYQVLPYQANTWLASRAAGAAWCARLGIGPVPQGYFDFPAGSMFWARVDALKPLFEVGITLNDFVEEQGQTDGTFAHCLERLLVLSSLKQGCRPGIIKNMQRPTWSAWGFEQYAARPFQQLVHLLEDPAITLIAFDIYDTLLCRPMIDAESIKAIVAQRIGGSTAHTYMQFRPLAEAQARACAGKDVGMTEIFAQLGILTNLPDDVLRQLRGLEEEVEQASVGPRSGGLLLYQKALATRKPVVLISDMFLPRAVIEECLRGNGISGWTSMFVSNEVGLRKDSGELYAHVLSHHGVSPAQMVMIGDNERSDWQIPCDMGIHVIHVLKPSDFARALPRFGPLIDTNRNGWTLDCELTLGLVLQQNFSPISFPQLDPECLLDPTAFNVGYSLIGPLLVALSQWLVETARSDRMDRLYFLAREGQLMKMVHDIWVDGLDDVPHVEYLVLSRRTVSVPTLDSLEDILTIARTTFYENTISNFLFERYGLQLSVERWAELTDQVQWNSASPVEVHHQRIDHIEPLLELLRSEIIANGALERNALLHYLRSKGLDKPGRQAVVDIGYSATIQNYLNRIATTPVHGYYLITDQKADAVRQNHDVLVRGCYLEHAARESTTSQMYLHSFELEKLLSSSAAQVVRYTLDLQNLLTAHHRELSNDESECSSFRSKLQDGVLRYTRDARGIRDRLLPGYRPSREVARQLYEAFIAQQSQRETEMLQTITLDDYYCGRGLVR